MFRRRRPEPAAPAAGPGLRDMVLALDPRELGLSPVDVWGVVMDTGMGDGGWHSLVVLGDGTTSLYTSGAFGIIGAGPHEQVRRASDALLASAAEHLALFTPETDTATPPEDVVVIRAMTVSGRRVVVAPEEDLGRGRHPASAVFHAAHAVITELRLLPS